MFISKQPGHFTLVASIPTTSRRRRHDEPDRSSAHGTDVAQQGHVDAHADDQLDADSLVKAEAGAVRRQPKQHGRAHARQGQDRRSFEAAALSLRTYRMVRRKPVAKSFVETMSQPTTTTHLLVEKEPPHEVRTIFRYFRSVLWLAVRRRVQTSHHRMALVWLGRASVRGC